MAEARSDPPPDTLPQLPRWYAIWVMSHAEFVIEDAIECMRIEVFLPTWNEVTQWTDRKKTIRRPLFPGYLFACCEQRMLGAVLRVAGVIHILPNSLKPEPVPGEELTSIRRALASGLPMKPCPYVAGDAVLIDHGPLAGVKGLVQRTRNGTIVVVKIEMLQRAVCVEISADELVKEQKAA